MANLVASFNTVLVSAPFEVVKVKYVKDVLSTLVSLSLLEP